MTDTTPSKKNSHVPKLATADAGVEGDDTSREMNEPPEDEVSTEQSQRKGPEWWHRLGHCWNWYFRRGRDWGYRGQPGPYDDKWNEESKLHEDEGVAVPAIWVTEVFTPSNATHLATGIKRLQWTQSRNDDKRLQKWMGDVRQGRIGGSTRMGRITAHSSSDLFTDSTADLPKGVRAVFPTLTAVTGSMTVLTARFVLEDETATSLEAVLRKDYESKRTHQPGIPLARILRYIFRGGPMWFPGYGHMSPDMGRRADAQKAIKQIEDSCRTWMEHYFPGTFATISGVPMPTAALFITEKAMPLSEEAGQVGAFEGLGIGRHYDAWTSKEWSGGRMALPSSWAGESERLTFACRRHDAFVKDDHHHEPK